MSYLKYLYPAIEPYHTGFYSPNDSKHRIYYEISGNPDGIPVVYVHGGPGGGTSAVCRRFFDPQKYKIILIDQRGCGKSTPSICTTNNTTDYLVEDMEAIRKSLNIEKWVLFGGSWGTTLSLCYAIKYPQNVLKMVLRGIYLNRRSDIDWLFEQGASYFKPEEFDQFCSLLSKKTHTVTKVHEYFELMNSTNEQLKTQACIEWAKWEMCLISVNKLEFNPLKNIRETIEIAYLENWYFEHNGFMEENYILNNVDKIKHIETYIVHGVYDLDCRPIGAYELHKALLNSKLYMLSKTAHTQREPKIAKTLVEIMQKLTF